MPQVSGFQKIQTPVETDLLGPRKANTIEKTTTTVAQQALFRPNPTGNENFVSRLTDLICRIYEQLGRNGEISREQNQKLETLYDDTSKLVAEEMRNVGKNGVLFAFLGIAAQVAPLPFIDPANDKAFRTALGTLFPGVEKFIDSRHQSKQSTASSKQALLNTKMTTAASKGQETSASKQEFQAFHNSLLEILKRASSQG